VILSKIFILKHFFVGEGGVGVGKEKLFELFERFLKEMPFLIRINTMGFLFKVIA